MNLQDIREQTNRLRCDGTGRPASLDHRTGFFACPECKTICGVILSPLHRTPEHAAIGAGMFAIPSEEQRYVMRPEHRSVAVCSLAAQSGFSKDWTIDLLVRLTGMLTRDLARMRETDTRNPLTVMGLDGSVPDVIYHDERKP